MSRPRAVPTFVMIAFLVGLVAVGYALTRTYQDRAHAVHNVATSRSELHLGLSIHHDRGPIADEEYRMSDINGISTARYRASNRHGVTITVELVPQPTYDVSFFFGRVDHDGIWKLTNRPPRGDLTTRYTLDVGQLIDGAHGSRRISFTDPHYWATTAGHQYRIHLERNKPVPDLLTLSSTTLADPRYLRVVDDFRAFGPEEFRAKVSAAQARLAAPT
ncbi:MAG: hypothetical protein ACREM8_12805 [Vulcanimicrobiaceae bacterium]